MFQAAGQMVQQKTPPPPMDPAIKATYDVGMAEVNRKAKLDDATINQKNQELTLGAKMDQLQQMIDARAAETKAANELQIAQMREAYAAQTSHLDGQIQLMKNDADNKQHQITELLKNRDDNQTQLMIEQMKQHVASIAAPPQQNPQQDGMLKEMQRTLDELRKAKTDDALSAVMQGLQSMIEGQRSHQENMLQMAGKIMQGGGE